MASAITPTVFPDNQLVAKSDLRNQFQIAATEISALQLATKQPRKLAFDDTAFDNL
jgi:hypothetical protein